jgi:TPR repeat protein
MAYLQGMGVPPNRTEAIRWFRKAADKGDEDAKTALKSLGAQKGCAEHSLSRCPYCLIGEANQVLRSPAETLARAPSRCSIGSRRKAPKSIEAGSTLLSAV